MSIKKTSDKEFTADVIDSNQPVLVDFWAEWCNPCKMVSPILEAIAKERKDLKIVKLNIDENQSTAAQFGIQSIPTMLIFKNGEKIGTIVGAQPKTLLTKAIDSIL